MDEAHGLPKSDSFHALACRESKPTAVNSVHSGCYSEIPHVELTKRYRVIWWAMCMYRAKSSSIVSACKRCKRLKSIERMLQNPEYLGAKHVNFYRTGF